MYNVQCIMMNGGCCGGAKFCVSTRTGAVNPCPCEVLLFRYCVPLRVRGSVWPRTHRAFSLRREARYRRGVSIRQAAKRNGGGVLVAFVVVCGRQYRKSHLHSVWRSGEVLTRQGMCERVWQGGVAREGTQAKRNLGLARARELRESVVFENSWLFRGCFCARKTKLKLVSALPTVNFRFFVCI